MRFGFRSWRAFLLDIGLVLVVVYVVAFYVFDLPFWVRATAAVIGTLVLIAFPLVGFFRSRHAGRTG